MRSKPKLTGTGSGSEPCQSDWQVWYARCFGSTSPRDDGRSPRRAPASEESIFGALTIVTLCVRA
jgi:hypothetical protein